MWQLRAGESLPASLCHLSLPGRGLAVQHLLSQETCVCREGKQCFWQTWNQGETKKHFQSHNWGYKPESTEIHIIQVWFTSFSLKYITGYTDIWAYILETSDIFSTVCILSQIYSNIEMAQFNQTVHPLKRYNYEKFLVGLRMIVRTQKLKLSFIFMRRW